MYLVPFTHHRPASLDEVFETLGRHGDDAAVYAGGTELLLALKARVLRYEHLIDLKQVKELSGIRVEGKELVIGALATHHQIANSDVVKAHVPAYAALSEEVANIRVRAAGTLAGNLAFAEPHSDPPSLLSAMDATLILVSPGGKRAVPMRAFILSEFTTAREENELIAEIRIPVTAAGEGFAYRKFGHLERPAVGASAGCIMREGKPSYRLWFGAIGDHPLQATEIEDAIAGVPATSLPDVLPRAARDFAAGISTASDLHGSADYKQHLASVLIQRALAAACEAAQNKGAANA